MRDPLAPALRALETLTIARMSAAESLVRMNTARDEFEEPHVRILMGPLEVVLEVLPMRPPCHAMAQSRAGDIATSAAATIDLWGEAPSRFTTASDVLSLAFDDEGALWASDAQAIYRTRQGEAGSLERVGPADGHTFFAAGGSVYASLRDGAIVVTNSMGARTISLDDEPIWFGLSPAGDRLATADEAFVMVFDCASGAVISMLRQRANAVCFLPDPRKLITATREGIAVWDLALRSREQFLATDGEVHSVALSPDRRWLLAAVGTRAEAWHLDEERQMGSCAVEAAFDRCIIADEVAVTSTGWLRWRNAAS